MRYNYFQPIYLEYPEALTQDITGWVMPFPNIDQFNLHYGKEKEKAPTESLLNVIRLLLPQIRVINKLIVDGQPNPAAFLASEQVDTKILSLIFRKWIEVWYPESQHEYLKSLCNSNQFNWQPATPEILEWWSPAWAIAKILTEQEYQLGNDKFKLFFGPGRKENTVELVSWPPFTTPTRYKSSIGIVISTQSDLIGKKRINIHFKMKRWVVQRGDNSDINLQSKATHCYIRRFIPWSGEDLLPDPNMFISLEAKNFKIVNNNNNRNQEILESSNRFERRWKDNKVLEILEQLSVEIPQVEDVLQNPLNFIETDQTDILIPARSSQKRQKGEWGTGFTIVDTRLLLRQIISFLPAGVTLTQPWKKISTIKENKKIEEQVKKGDKSIKNKFIKHPAIKKPSKNELPELSEELKDFLKQRANNITLHVCTRTPEVQAAIEQVANHYFGDSLNLEFYSSHGLAAPIKFEKSNKEKSKNKKIPDIKYIKDFGKKYKLDNPEPIIVEILHPDHPSYKGDADPKSYIKSQLPKYNLVPQCIVSSDGRKQTELENSILNRALSAILDAIMPFDKSHPLSNPEDNNVYAGFYLISRNKATSAQSFKKPVLVIIYKNDIKVLLPAQDTELRSLAEAICYLANQAKNKNKSDESTINTMLNQLIINYSKADNIYLYVHTHNARQYWTWLQDKGFHSKKSPTEKITIIRIRDLENNEVAEGYGLPTEKEDFTDQFDPEIASYTKGIFITQNCNLEEIPYNQTILSIANKPQTLKQQAKNRSRFEPWTSEAYEKEEKDGEKVYKLNPETGKRIKTDISNNPVPTKNWKEPQPRAHNILTTPSKDEFILHHAIAHHLRSCHWWMRDECEYPLPLSLARKIKEWCFSE